MVCSNCGVAFHCKFTLFGIFVSALGLVVGLAAIVLKGHPWIGMVVVLGTILWLAILASKSQLVVSTPYAARRWRLAIGALLVLYAVIEMWPKFVSH